jgi:hypothetical protein
MESWANKVECEAVELQKQLDAKVKSLGCENELAVEQEALSSHSLKMEQL